MASERLVTLHLVAEGVRGKAALFEVSLLLGRGQTEALRRGEHGSFRDALNRAHVLIREHVEKRRAGITDDDEDDD